MFYICLNTLTLDLTLWQQLVASQPLEALFVAHTMQGHHRARGVKVLEHRRITNGEVFHR